MRSLHRPETWRNSKINFSRSVQIFFSFASQRIPFVRRLHISFYLWRHPALPSRRMENIKNTHLKHKFESLRNMNWRYLRAEVRGEFLRCLSSIEHVNREEKCLSNPSFLFDVINYFPPPNLFSRRLQRPHSDLNIHSFVIWCPGEVDDEREGS